MAIQYVNFPFLRSTSIVAILQVPDGKRILVTTKIWTDAKCMHGVQMNVPQWQTTREVYLH